jgi:hypothetical protein
MPEGGIVRNFILAVTLLASIAMTAFVGYILADEIRMNRNFGEYNRRSYVIWPLILLVALAGVIVSWVSMPGSKWFVVAFYLPLALLLPLAIRFGEKRYIGGLLIFLLVCWVGFGGFLSSWAVYNTERGGSIMGKSNNCAYGRDSVTFRYGWRCSQEKS